MSGYLTGSATPVYRSFDYYFCAANVTVALLNLLKGNFRP
jgi:hypothetical protein